MAGYLSDLHKFYFEAAPQLTKAERFDLTEAMAYILKSVSDPNLLLNSLQLFLHPLLQQLHALSQSLTTDKIVLEQAEGKMTLTYITLITLIIRYSE